MSLPLKNPFKGQASDISDRTFIEDAGVRYFINVPDEDISTPARLMFVLEEAFWFYYDYLCAFSQTKNYASNFKKFLVLVVKYCPQITYFAKASQANSKDDKNKGWTERDIDDALTQFREYKSTIPVRGCCILNEQLDSILLVQDATSKTWSFPRGKIGKDEDDVKCAIRECFEETGLDLAENIRPDKYMNTNMQGKQIRIYFCTDVAMNVVEKFKPMSTYEIKDMKWFSVKSLKKLHGTKSKRHTFLVNALIFKISKFVNEESVEKKFVEAEKELKRILRISSSADPNEFINKHESTENPGANILNMIKKKSSSDSGKNSQIDLSGGTSIPITPPTNPGANVLSLLKKGTNSSNNIINEVNSEPKNQSLSQNGSGKSLLSLLQKKKVPEITKHDELLNKGEGNVSKSNAHSLLDLLQNKNKPPPKAVATTPKSNPVAEYSLTSKPSSDAVGSPMLQFQHLMQQNRQPNLAQFQPMGQHLPLQGNMQHISQEKEHQILPQQPIYMPNISIPNVNMPNYQMPMMQPAGFQGQFMNQQIPPQQNNYFAQQQDPGMRASPFQQASNMSPHQYLAHHPTNQQNDGGANDAGVENSRKSLLSLLNNAQRRDNSMEKDSSQGKNVLLNDINRLKPQTTLKKDESQILSNADLFQLLNNKKKNIVSNPHIGKANSMDFDNGAEFEDFSADAKASLPDETTMI